MHLQLAVAKDQLLPLLVMDTLKGMTGVPGLFVAGVFSAALRWKIKIICCFLRAAYEHPIDIFMPHIFNNTFQLLYMCVS